LQRFPGRSEPLVIVISPFWDVLIDDDDLLLTIEREEEEINSSLLFSSLLFSLLLSLTRIYYAYISDPLKSYPQVIHNFGKVINNPGRVINNSILEFVDRRRFVYVLCAKS